MTIYWKARYNEVDYDKICSMILTVARIKGPLPLKETVADMSKQLSLGIDAAKVYKKLGPYVHDVVEDELWVDSFNNRYTIRKVKTMVIP